MDILNDAFHIFVESIELKPASTGLWIFLGITLAVYFLSQFFIQSLLFYSTTGFIKKLIGMILPLFEASIWFIVCNIFIIPEIESAQTAANVLWSTTAFVFLLAGAIISSGFYGLSIGKTFTILLLTLVCTTIGGFIALQISYSVDGRYKPAGESLESQNNARHEQLDETN